MNKYSVRKPKPLRPSEELAIGTAEVLGGAMLLSRHPNYVPPSTKVENKDGILRFLRALGAGREVCEVFWVIGLDSQSRLIGCVEVGRGGERSLRLEAPVVYRVACLLGACGIILAHNHPSNSMDPSEEDMHLTKTLQKGLRVIDRPLIDHVIYCGDAQGFSFFEAGLLKELP